MLAHGYDSASRVAFWADQLETAARSQLGSTAEAEKNLREALNSTFRRLVDKPSVAGRLAVERIKPALRTELDRRVLASTNLINLTREEALLANRRRFLGWATSIPAGGSGGASPEEIRHSLNELPRVDRKIVQDQSAKLASNISGVVADAGDALAGRWFSNWKVPGYKFRENHKHRDGEVHLRRGSWALVEGLIKKNGMEYTDEIEAPAEWPYCRCRYIWIYNLEDLPKEFLTERGKRYLREQNLKESA